MSEKPRTPYRRRGDFQSRNRLRGAFVSGVWHCDCDPRLPAEHFKVKKEGPNTGRWFYTCQRKQCGFFLWDDDAKPREEVAVLHSSRNEPANSHNQDYPSSSTTLHNKPSHDTLPSPPPSNFGKGLKRKIDFEEDDGFDWSLTGEENQELAQAVDTATTPSKSRDGQFMTPKRRKLPWMDEKDTPVSLGATKQALLTPWNKTITTPSDRISAASSRTQAPDTTPTPARFRNVETSDTGIDQMEEEIMGIFRGRRVHIDQATEQAIHQSLAKYDRKVQGFVQSRDMLRLTVKAKDAKIAELQHGIATLEAEREIDRAMMSSGGRAEDS